MFVRSRFSLSSRIALSVIAGTTVGLFLWSPAQHACAGDSAAGIEPRRLARAEEIAATFRQIAKASRDGVVQVRCEGDEKLAAEIRKRLQSRSPDISDEEIDARVERHMHYEAASASGIILDRNGNILTNNHVVARHTQVRVALADGREFDAQVVGADRKGDLAVIRIDATDLTPLPFGDSDGVEVGDWVIAVGAPFGLSHSVTHGIVSALNRNIPALDIAYQDFIQTDAAVNPGNSGGPLLNMRGEVIGVNTAIVDVAKALTGDPDPMNISFALPGNAARKIATQLIDHGAVSRGWLGIQLGDVSRSDARVLGSREGIGAFVDGVVPGTPAANAGLLPDDLILSINGAATPVMAKARAAIADIPPHVQASLKIIRDGEPLSIDVELGEQPPETRFAGHGSAMDARVVEPLGVSVRALLPSFVHQTRKISTTQRGLRIMGIHAGGDGDPLNANDDIIVACNGTPIATVADLLNALQARNQDTVELRVLNSAGVARTVSRTIQQ